MKLTYEQVASLVEEYGCKLVTTKSTFLEKQLNSKSFYEIIAACGHSNVIKYDIMIITIMIRKNYAWNRI